MLAYRKPTVQSSTFDGRASSLAVDGNINAVNASCTHTNWQADPWWRVDLLDPVQVVYLFIVNRWDCCSDRLHNFEIRIGNSLGNNGNSNPQCGGLHSLNNVQSKVIPCASPLIGRYINIIIPGPRKLLTLCEVQVHGFAGGIIVIIIIIIIIMIITIIIIIIIIIIDLVDHKWLLEMMAVHRFPDWVGKMVSRFLCHVGTHAQL